MLDFTNLPTSNKLYPGGSGAKRAVIYQGEQYLLKFPATSSKNKNSGHSTSYAAEYIAIFSTALESAPKIQSLVFIGRTARKRSSLPAKISRPPEWFCRILPLCKIR